MIPIVKFSMYSALAILAIASPLVAEPGNDNTARNVRDRDNQTVTPLDQSNDPHDIQITQQIRKAIVDAKGLSVTAQNVKIITIDGHVTLRGPVRTAEEKRLIGDIAARVAPKAKVENQLEVAEQASAL